MTDNEFKYCAFLTFSAEDNGAPSVGAPEVGRLQWGDWLREALKTFPIPPDFAGHVNAHGEMVPERIDSIFQDDQELPEGTGLSAAVREALDQSRCLIVICSPRSAKSAHVNEAVRYFKQLGRGSRILAIVIAGEPNAAAAHQPGLFSDDECFVPAMCHPVLPDGTLDTTRQERGYIFADARHGDDKREVLVKDYRNLETELERAKIQLIAGLIGVGFNGLWQREQNRRFAGFAEAQAQIQEAWHQARQAQKQAEETQKQVEALQQEARAAEGKVLEAQQQLAEARHQVPAAPDKALEMPSLPPDLESQIHQAQDRAQAAENQARAAQGQVQQLHKQVREAENQLAQARNQAQEVQRQLDDARKQAREAQSKVLEAQQQARAAHQQLEEARHQVQAAPDKVLDLSNQPPDPQGQIHEAQNRAQAAESQVRAAQTQVQQLQDQVHEAENQTLEASGQARNAQDQMERLENKARAAQRLTKIFALLAALALLAAGIVWSHRKMAGAKTAEISPEPLATSGSATNELDSDQIRQALQNANGAGHLQDLDQLATRIPPQKISETLNMAAAILDDPQRRHFQEQLLDSWVKADVAAAFNWSRQLTNLESRQFALEKSIPAMAADNSSNALAAFNWLQSQTNADALATRHWRNAIVADLFKTWAAKDLDAAATASGQLPEDATKERVSEIILNERIAETPAAAADVITNLPPGDFRQKAIADLGQHWGSNDAPAALAWAQTLTSEAESSNAIGQIIGSWARNDFAAATNGIAGLPDGNKKISALLALAEPWAQQDAQDLATNALALPAGEVQTAWLTAACRRLAVRDFAATAELLRPLPDAALRQSLLEQAARNCDLPHLDEAATYVAAMPADDDQKAAIKGLLACWTTNDPEAALNWLCAFSQTNSQAEPIQSVIRTWSQAEPAAAAKWLANVPAPTASDEITSAFLAGVAGRYPEFAAQWTQTVTDEGKREKFQIQVARQWLTIDSPPALKWIATLELPEEMKQRLISGLDF
jgi:predicted  nucleic acid-binding Zn-ribbon protein